MNENKPNHVLQLIKNRRTTKKMLSNYVIDDEILNTITEAIRWSPSSYGIWTYRILVLPRNSLRKELITSFASQNPFINASHVILFISAKEKYIKDVLMAKSLNSWIPIPDVRENWTNATQTNWQQNHVLIDWWAQKQAYIGLSAGLIAATDMKIDTTPMEGFNKDAVNEILAKHNLIDLEKEQFIVALALGKADLTNPRVHLFNKVRMDKKEFTTILKAED